jgi:SEC-C motif
VRGTFWLTLGLTLNQETSNRVSEVILPPRLGRNETCHCGSGSKYKRCCWERDEALRRQLRGRAVPAWIDDSRGRLRQFEKYACNVFGLPDLLANLVDTRRAPKIPTFDVVNSLFHTAVLRIPSINASEGDLKDSDFQKLIGRPPTPDVKAFSADVVANVQSARVDFPRLMADLIAEELSAIPELPKELAEFGVSHHPVFANVSARFGGLTPRAAPRS